jgi:DNA replication protein DnaC
MIEPVIELLRTLKLHGMADALARQFTDPDISALRFEERLSLLLQHEAAERDNYRIANRLRVATLPQPATLEDLDTRLPRNLDPTPPHHRARSRLDRPTLECTHHRPHRNRQILHRGRPRQCRLPRQLSRALLPHAAPGR